MKCRYIGSGDDAPVETVFQGVHFRMGQWVNVDNPTACQKIMGSSCFEIAPGHEIEDAEFVEIDMPKKRGRPRKVVSDGDEG